MSSAMLLFLALFVMSAVVSAVEYNGTVYYDSVSQRYSLKRGVVDGNGAATVLWSDDVDVNGWGVLTIETSKRYADEVQMYAAGYAEGAMTWNRVFENYLNMYQEFFGEKEPSEDVLKFFKAQDEWVRSQVRRGNDEYWEWVGLIQAQFDGLFDGYNGNVEEKYKLSLFSIQFLNANGDLLDLRNAFEGPKDYSSMTLDQLQNIIALNGHCSAIVKVPGDYSDLWSSHSSWFTYRAMNRIYKHYNFNVKANAASKKVSFSSYPGYISSLDDFYIMSNGLVMIQTTNNVFNHSLFVDNNNIRPQSLWAWQRVRLANMFANGGKEWADIFAKHNSGTYNNQYMVVDYNKFTPGQPLGENLLWVVEQIPGLVVSADQTSQLERGYWASYNVPFYPEIYKLSGYPEFVKKHGVEFSYEMAPRAQIFRRDQGKVTDLETLKDLMRYNDYLNDPISKGNPGNAICSRFDLQDSPVAAGCYDTKVTSNGLQKTMTSYAINGPTTSNNIPPFTWKQFEGIDHFGQVETFNFDFIEMQPKFSRN